MPADASLSLLSRSSGQLASSSSHANHSGISSGNSLSNASLQHHAHHQHQHHSLELMSQAGGMDDSGLTSTRTHGLQESNDRTVTQQQQRLPAAQQHHFHHSLSGSSRIGDVDESKRHIMSEAGREGRRHDTDESNRAMSEIDDDDMFGKRSGAAGGMLDPSQLPTKRMRRDSTGDSSDMSIFSPAPSVRCRGGFAWNFDGVFSGRDTFFFSQKKE